MVAGGRREKGKEALTRAQVGVGGEKVSSRTSHIRSVGRPEFAGFRAWSERNGSAWGAQSVKLPTWAQVMISRFRVGAPRRALR